MQRLFSMFPAGLPGIALVFLRLSVALALLLGIQPQWPMSGWLYLAAAPLLVSLWAGWLTPLTAVLALSLHGVIWALAAIPASGVALPTTLDCLALALLGPGAYSVDARCFGRRVILPRALQQQQEQRARMSGLGRREKPHP